MEDKRDQVVRQAEAEKEKGEIFGIPFAFPDIAIDDYVKGKKDEKERRERLVVYTKEINIIINEAQQKGDIDVDVEKIVRTFLKSRKAGAVSRSLNKVVKESEREEKVETPGLEEEKDKSVKPEEDEIKKAGGEKKAEIKENDIANKVNDLIENIKIKLGAAQVSGFISEEKLEKFNHIFDDKIKELNGMLKDGNGADDSDAKLNEFHEDLLKLKDTFFRQPKDAEIKQREELKLRKEKYKKKKKPRAKSKKDKFYQRKENPADESLSLEKDPSNPGQHFDFIDEEKETEYENEIKKASTFEEFYEAIRKIGRMRNNSGNIIPAEQVIRKIDITRELLRKKSKNFNLEDEKWTELWKKYLDLIPEICGIRNKIGELIREEIYGKGKTEEEKLGKSEKEFTAGEKRVMDVFVEYAKKYQEKFEAETNWAGYSDGQKNDTMNIQTAVSIKLKMAEKNLFEGKEDEVIEEILKSKV